MSMIKQLLKLVLWIMLDAFAGYVTYSLLTDSLEDRSNWAILWLFLMVFWIIMAIWDVIILVCTAKTWCDYIDNGGTYNDGPR